ncbi:MAG: flagellar hook protein FlgE [Gammaproteobacteria bacterium]|nr:flagellar hook protein FlgE [Gammaproteobacteria bacterium]
MPFRSAVSGINAAQSDLKVIGNNVANSNTTGFKSSRAEFADVFPASQFGSGSTAIGGGVRLSAVRQQFTQGTISFTDNAMDLAITGRGFFRLNGNGETLYSRAGAFGVDKDGFIENSLGMRLTGFTADNGQITGVLGDLQISAADNAPRATSAVDMTANLDAGVSAKSASDPPLAMGPEIFDAAGNSFAPQRFAPPDPDSYHHTSSLQVFDTLGVPHNTTMYFRKNADNDWEIQLSIDNQAFVTPAEGTNLQFDTSGVMTGPAGPPLGVLTYAAVPVGSGAADLNFSVDLSQTTQFGSSFGVNELTQDGFTTGRLSSVEVNDEGEVVAQYTNGQTQLLGQVALANFSNESGLSPMSDTVWAESSDSGAPLLGAPGSASLGLVQSSALEESNVDLTEELVKLIVAQRNFQANAQVIRTADETTQTIVNLR